LNIFLNLVFDDKAVQCHMILLKSL